MINDDLIVSEVQAAPIPLIETASIPLPIQNFSEIIDLNVGTIPLQFLDEALVNSTTYLPEESLGDDIEVQENRSKLVFLTPVYFLLLYCY